MENNIPAFPKSGVAITEEGRTSIEGAEDGMSLLDYFAAHAPDVPDWFDSDTAKGTRDEESLAIRFYEWRYFYAKQMLEARKNYIK